MQICHKFSGITGPKFSKFVAVVYIFFSDDVNSIIRVAILPPVIEGQGRHLKKESSIGKHKPAGVIAMLGGLKSTKVVRLSDTVTGTPL